MLNLCTTVRPMEKQDQAESAVGGEGDQSVLGTEGEYYSVTI